MLRHVAKAVPFMLLGAWCGPAAAQWNVQAFGNGTMANVFDVKVGRARNDGTNRVYISERNGRVMEWTYTGTGWTNMVVARGVTNLALIAIANVRGDGSNRLYYTEFRTNGALHEAVWTGSAWATSVVDKTYQSLSLFTGAGRGDGVKRLYVGTSGDAAHTGRGLWEYSYTTGAWSKICLHTNGMEGAGAVGDLRNDSTNRVLANSSFLDDFTWTGTNYEAAAIDHSATLFPDPTDIGKARNDGLTRVFINSGQGKIEYSYGGGTWSKKVIDANVQRGDVLVARLKGDGLYRLYSTYTTKGGVKGPLVEFLWDSISTSYRSNVVVDGTTGATANIAAGNGRNDGVARLYAPDYAGGRILEITWNAPFVYPSPSNTLQIAGMDVTNGNVYLVLTNLTAECEYSVQNGTNLLGAWSNAAVFTAASSVTNWSVTNGPSPSFFRVKGRLNDQR